MKMPRRITLLHRAHLGACPGHRRRKVQKLTGGMGGVPPGSFLFGVGAEQRRAMRSKRGERPGATSFSWEFLTAVAGHHPEMKRTRGRYFQTSGRRQPGEARPPPVLRGGPSPSLRGRSPKQSDKRLVWIRTNLECTAERPPWDWFGYRYDPATDTRSFNEAEAATVRVVFTRFADGASYHGLTSACTFHMHLGKGASSGQPASNLTRAGEPLAPANHTASHTRSGLFLVHRDHVSREGVCLSRPDWTGCADGGSAERLEPCPDGIASYPSCLRRGRHRQITAGR
jgi:hypothetical protein